MSSSRSVTVRRAARATAAAAVMALIALALAACQQAHAGQERRMVAGGDPHRGPAAVAKYGCGSCHVIPGVQSARGESGPPLTQFGARSFIAGEVGNTPENLIHWIEVPQSIEPGTAMPNLGVNEQDARDIAAYLYTLR